MSTRYQGLIIAGHRGYGCTDHNFYNFRDIKNLPVENTIESIQLAFKNGVAYIETDAVFSNDGVLFTIHNVVPDDHFFDQEKPNDLLNKLTFSDIQKYKTGHANGTVATLDEILNTVHQCSPKTLTWDINIEIKGVQGSKQNYEDKDFLKNIAETVESSQLKTNRILFSSFSLENITRMSHLLPTAQYGMLFCEDKDGEKISSPAYVNHTQEFSYRYQPFDVDHIERIIDFWKANAHPTIELNYIHPEINSITENTVALAASAGFGINCWALFEQLDDDRKEQYKKLASWCEKHDVFISVITDYCDEMIELAETLPKGPMV